MAGRDDPCHPAAVAHRRPAIAFRLVLAGALVAVLAGPAAGAGRAPVTGGTPGSTGAAPGSSPDAVPGAASDRGVRPLRSLPTSLLVTLRPGAGPAAADEAAAALGLVRVAWNPDLRTAQYVMADEPRSVSPDARSLAVAILAAGRVNGPERSRLARLGAAMRKASGVLDAHPPIRLEPAEDPPPVPPPDPPPSPAPTPPAPVAAPNDPLWGSQWGLDAAGVRSAWALTRGRPEIVVAVIDTGVDLGHPDLVGRLIPGTDLGSGDADPSDEHGHGTHVAGIVAATAGNARGVSGAAPAVVVMPVKVSWFDLDGSLVITEETVAEAILWAVARGARVVNLSLGAPNEQPSAVINAAIDSARARGVVVVAAAGNHAATAPGPGVSQPGAYGPVLTVAAVTDGGPSLGGPGSAARYAPAAYSNSGPEVDLAAPGTSILSTIPRWASTDYGYLSGTSMATPFVSAVAALVLSRDPSLTADRVEAALIGSAVDLGPAGPDPETGAGLLSAGAAVASVPAPASDGAAPAVRISGIADGTVVRGVVTVTFAAADASAIVATRVYRDGGYYLVRRSGSVAVRWNTAGGTDGLHRWSGYATDAGRLVGTATARVLVANRRQVVEVRTSRLMTSTVRSITRAVTVSRSGPFVARFRGPPSSRMVVRLVSSSGRVVAEARGTGSAAIAISSLRAGRYMIRASTSVARPGLSLRLSAAWFR